MTKTSRILYAGAACLFSSSATLQFVMNNSVSGFLYALVAVLFVGTLMFDEEEEPKKEK